MELHSYVAQVQEQLETAAALGDDRTQQTAAALATAAAPAMRLAVLSAVSAAADEITAALLDSPGAPAVSIRLDGDELRVEVRATADQGTPAPADDGDASARISLRLSESLKADIESAARRDALSVNSWLVRAATTALTPQWGPGMRNGDPRRGPGRPGNAHHVTGWING
ncbi:hypothetical protein [Jatrophihabitans sp.]|uniref:hypothetical protein n=1 Tax=Jatrophihabitans sp. TaxID=1932789 RepID=UPI0030C6607D|nr:putative transcriptional regulator, CopG family [Jatrophihabitans sp.]